MDTLVNSGNNNSDSRIIHESEKELQQLYNDLLLAHCPNMIYIFNNKLNLALNSNSCLSILKHQDKASLVNLPLKEIFSARIAPDWIEKIYKDNKAVLDSGEPMSFDDAIGMDNCEIMHVSITIDPVIKNEQIIGTIMTVNNMTELVNCNIKAEAAAKSKSNFLANMSHEIRTPMNAVKGLSELLALTDLSGLQRNYVDNIINSANSLLSIINDVLDFSKIDANKIEFIKGPFNLSEMISSTANLVSMKAEAKDLQMLVDVDPNLPTTISGDDVRIKQIMTNLLSNAVKYTESGTVLLKIKLDNKNGINWFFCEVSDTGIGIKDEELEFLFDAFARADQQKNRNIAGTGLGLAISKQLTNAMGGDIWVNSEYGTGTTFGFRIPINIIDKTPIAQVNNQKKLNVLVVTGSDASRSLIPMLKSLKVDFCIHSDDMIPEDIKSATHCIFDDTISESKKKAILDINNCPNAIIKDMRHAMDLNSDSGTILYLPLFIVDVARFLNNKEKSQEVIGTSGRDVKVENVKVLVVDDNEINLIVSGEMLSAFDADVHTAESGREAIDKCEKEKYDIIFMDHMMPEMNGIETTEYIRGHKGLNRITPIVALTANVVNDMKEKYMACGMNDFISKPIEFADLSRILKSWLPKEKIDAGSCIYSPGDSETDSGAGSKGNNTMSPEALVDALDNFGLYTTDVLKEMSGDFDGYIDRMEKASGVLSGLVEKLKKEVSEENWGSFTKDILDLRNLLYGVGARDCAGRARNLAIASRDGNVPYIHGDFYSLMGNMYMLDKKLDAIIPVGRGESLEENPLNTSQYLNGVIEKLGRAIDANDAVEAMSELENAATFSLNMDLDMGLKEIKKDLEKGDFTAAKVHHSDTMEQFINEVMKSEG